MKKALACLVGLLLVLFAQCLIQPRTHLDNLPSVIMGKDNPTAPHTALIQIRDMNDQFICSGFVFSDNYAATAAHCLKIGEEYKIHDENGVDVHVKAVAAALNPRQDYGVIKGKFTSFRHAPIDPYSNGFITGKHFVTCGFAQGQNRPTCAPFVPLNIEYFAMKGYSMLYPGMSGGPVMDIDSGVVVAVNSAVADGYVIVTPLTGLFGACGIE